MVWGWRRDSRRRWFFFSAGALMPERRLSIGARPSLTPPLPLPPSPPHLTVTRCLACRPRCEGVGVGAVAEKQEKREEEAPLSHQPALSLIHPFFYLPPDRGPGQWHQDQCRQQRGHRQGPGAAARLHRQVLWVRAGRADQVRQKGEKRERERERETEREREREREREGRE